MVKPPLQYFGAKTTIAPAIVALLPPHDHYVEPYCGSLAVLLAKPPVKLETVNDLDGLLMLFWRVLRDRPEDLARVCALTPHSRGEYESHKLTVDAGEDLETARRVWLMLSQGRGGSLRGGKNGWKHHVLPGSTSIGLPAYLDGYVGRMAAVAERLHAVSLESMPALDLIAKYGVDPDVLLFVDPPYLGETRNPRSNYRHEMRDEADHRQLAEALHAAASAVVICGYPSDLYDRELYAGWDRHTITTSTGNADPSARARVEVLWSNRPLTTPPPPPPSLFDEEAP